MHLNGFGQQVRDQLIASAALGDERTQQIAGVLAGTVSASVRLAVLDALSEASAEITTALFEATAATAQPSPAVTIQLDGDQARMVLTHPPAEPAGAPRADDGEVSARISLRLSESLKAEVEQAAAREGVSVNSWLIRVAGAALGGQPWPNAGPWPGSGTWPGGQSGRGSSRITGWITG